MQHAKGTLIGKKSLRLIFASWLPEGEPGAVAVLVHGYGEHMGRYTHVVEALVDQGYAVYGIDHRGHGGSAGTRAHVERFDNFVEDLHLLVRKVRETHPDLQTFMIGHSMGGLIATRYALRHQPELAGLILSGAALHVGDNVSPTLKRVSRLLATLVPTFPLLRTTRGPESVLSRDPAIQEAFNGDPLCYKGKLRARMGYEFMRATVDARARAVDLTLPLLVMHGDEDRLTNPQGSIHLHQVAGSADKTLKLWPGLRHEIFNEPERAEVIGFMLDWLRARVHQHESTLAQAQAA